MKYRFYTVDVFTDQAFGGNPLAVFPDADGLTQQQMQMIAREFNLSETVFVQQSQRHDCINRLRIFTPQTELPFAGHPTLGTAFLLASLGAVYLEGDETQIVFEEAVGRVPVRLSVRDGKPCFTRLSVVMAPEFGPAPPDAACLAKILSLQKADFADEIIQSVSCGLPYLLIPLRDRHAVARVCLDHEAWHHYLADYWAPQIYVYCHDAMLPGSHLRARMFAPGLGVAEDPATGSAACALGVALALRQGAATGCWRWVVEQGFELSRPSFIEVQVEKEVDGIRGVHVGGRCIRVAEGVMEVPFIEGDFSLPR